MHVIATAGHVDHGKSTLIRSLTGMEPDRWSEERRRGLTIDLGFAWTRMSDGSALAFVDVPGHERFVTNMLAGIGPVPAVLFVVAADEGWMPQSGEHLAALDALGVEHGVLAVTRCDRADPGRAAAQARAELSRTSLAGIPAVHVSGKTGTGLADLRAALERLVHRLPGARPAADLRLWIDRAFHIRGAGTVVTGTLPAGRVRVGQHLELHPAGRQVVVRGLHSLEQAHEEVAGVARVAVNLRNVSLEGVHRGDALLEPGRWLSTDTADVRVRGTPAGELARELMLHIGSAGRPVRVRPLGADTARLTLRSPLPLRIGDRALLRDPGGHRICGVLVLDVRPPPLNRRGAARARAAELAAVDGEPDADAELRRRGLVHSAELRAMGAAPSGDAWLLDDAYRDELAARLTELLAEHRRAQPLDDGMPADAARRALALPDPALLRTVADRAGIPLRAGRLGSAPLPERVRRAVDAIRLTLADDPFSAPTAEELADLGVGDRELAAAARAGELLRIAPGLVLLPDAERDALRELAQLPDPFTLSQARQALGTSRRVAVPLMEHLARCGHTRRLPDGNHQLVPANAGGPQD